MYKGLAINEIDAVTVPEVTREKGQGLAVPQGIKVQLPLNLDVAPILNPDAAIYPPHWVSKNGRLALFTPVAPADAGDAPNLLRMQVFSADGTREIFNGTLGVGEFRGDEFDVISNDLAVMGKMFMTPEGRLAVLVKRPGTAPYAWVTEEAFAF